MVLLELSIMCQIQRNCQLLSSQDSVIEFLIETTIQWVTHSSKVWFAWKWGLQRPKEIYGNLHFPSHFLIIAWLQRSLESFRNWPEMVLGNESSLQGKPEHTVRSLTPKPNSQVHRMWSREGRGAGFHINWKCIYCFSSGVKSEF